MKYPNLITKYGMLTPGVRQFRLREAPVFQRRSVSAEAHERAETAFSWASPGTTVIDRRYRRARRRNNVPDPNKHPNASQEPGSGTAVSVTKWPDVYSVEKFSPPLIAS